MELLLCVCLACEVPLRTGVGLQFVDIFEVVLPVAATNDVKSGANESHAVASTHLWLLFGVGEVVAVHPGLSLGFKCVQVVEALGMRARATEEVKFLLNSTKRHTGSGRRAFSLNLNLAPESLLKVEHE